jgi:hypothetical protein
MSVRREIETRLLMGLPPSEIAREVGVKIGTVKAQVRKLRARWSRQTRRPKAECVPDILAQLDEVQRQAWFSWKRSLDFLAKSSRTTKQLPGETQEQMTVSRAEQLGDTRCLVVILQCLKLRIELLGLDEDSIHRAFALPEVPGLDELLETLPQDQLEKVTASGKVVEGLLRKLGLQPDEAACA